MLVIQIPKGAWTKLKINGEVVRICLMDRYGKPHTAKIGIDAPRHVPIIRDDMEFQDREEKPANP